MIILLNYTKVKKGWSTFMAENRGIVDNSENFEEMFERVRKAQLEFSKFSQEQVDKIFLAAARGC